MQASPKSIHSIFLLPVQAVRKLFDRIDRGGDGHSTRLLASWAELAQCETAVYQTKIQAASQCTS